MAEITLTVDEQTLWEAVWGSGFDSFPWWRRVRYVGNADWDKPGKVLLTGANPNDDNYITKEITINSLLDALQAIRNTKRYHCGTLACTNIEDFDACEGDLVLQFAMFGEDIYA